jgi:hypothetical protein
MTSPSSASQSTIFLSEALDEPAARQQMPVSPVIFDGRGWGWTYLRMTDGGIYQLQGSLANHEAG